MNQAQWMQRVEELLEQIARNTATAGEPVTYGDLGLSSQQKRALNKIGIATMSDLRRADDQRLLSVEGIGEATVQQIREALAASPGKTPEAGPDAPPAPIGTLHLPSQQEAALLKDGYTTVADLQQATDEQLLAVDGVGKRTLEYIRGRTG